MKIEYQKPLTEIVILDVSNSVLEDESTDSTGHIPGDDDNILGNEGNFDEDDFVPSKSLWD